MRFQIKLFATVVWCCLFILLSCKKIVSIDEPRGTITTSEALRDSSNAVSAIGGMYANIANTGLSFLNGYITVDLGKCADELIPYLSSDDRLYSNSLTITNAPEPQGDMWVPAYFSIYQANAILEGLQSSKGIKENEKKQFAGEAKFFRALFYFYLINLFGDVPYLNSTDYSHNQSLSNTPKAEIYQHIVDDLLDAEANLPSDYLSSGIDRTRATKWAASALLARVYLYLGDWAKAVSEANILINNTAAFELNPELNNVFLGNDLGNKEAILQWDMNVSAPGFYNVTSEAEELIPADPPYNYPRFKMPAQLLEAFEAGDKRKDAWVGVSVYGNPGDTFYFPYKFKIPITQAAPNTPATEHITPLRLAEQYLIRAEANAQQNNLSDALNDLDIIRARAGLNPLPSSLDQSQVLAAVMQERRVELFAEFGHRWLDLKRTGQVDAVMSIATPLKGQNTVWETHQQLFPIPFGEIQSDPNLKQNPGY